MENEAGKVWCRDVDVAKHYDVSRKTVWDWVKRGILPPPVKIGPHSTRWHRSVLAERDGELHSVSE